MENGLKKMPVKYSSKSISGIPFGDNAKRPATPEVGQPFFNGEAARLELYTSSTGWQNITQETPSVTTIVGVYKESLSSNTLTINGTNFAAGCIAYATGSNGVDYQSDSTTLISAVELSATFSALSKLYEPYDIKVVNPSNLYGVLYETLFVDETPIWNTGSGTLGTYVEQSPMSISLALVDPENQPITFSVTSGSLPGGLSLNQSTGVISGTPEDIVPNTNYSFTINASDGQNDSYRSFSIYISDRGPTWNTAQTLPQFTKSVAYSTTLSASDDNGIASYTLFSGSLPPGLSIDQSTGVISGTATDSISKTFTIRATDNGGSYVDRQFSISNTGPIWNTTSPITLYKGATTQLSASDDGNITYSLVSGSFNTGVSMSSSGLISATTDAQSGVSALVFRATDENGTYSAKNITLTVASVTGGVLYQTPGNYNWTVPENVFSVSVVAVGSGGGGGSTADGSGGGGGAGLGYKNSIPVTPGSSYPLYVPPTTSAATAGNAAFFIDLLTVAGYGGQPGASVSSGDGGAGGSYVGDGGGNGGNGGKGTSSDGVDAITEGGGGGGAGGYSGAGGFGESASSVSAQRTTAGTGGAGGGGGSCDASGYGGGGVGIYGQGTSGAAGVNYSSTTSNGGSGGANGGLVPLGATASFDGAPGGNYGGGGGGGDSANGGTGGQGAVRIIWGDNRFFPATNTGQDFSGIAETVI